MNDPFNALTKYEDEAFIMTISHEKAMQILEVSQQLDTQSCHLLAEQFAEDFEAELIQTDANKFADNFIESYENDELE